MPPNELLPSTKTFHWLFAPLAAPGWAAALTVLVGYGHLLIGLSLRATK